MLQLSLFEPPSLVVCLLCVSPGTHTLMKIVTYHGSNHYACVVTPRRAASPVVHMVLVRIRSLLKARQSFRKLGEKELVIKDHRFSTTNSDSESLLTRRLSQPRQGHLFGEEEF